MVPVEIARQLDDATWDGRSEVGADQRQQGLAVPWLKNEQAGLIWTRHGAAAIQSGGPVEIAGSARRGRGRRRSVERWRLSKIASGPDGLNLERPAAPRRVQGVAQDIVPVRPTKLLVIAIGRLMLEPEDAT